jgi:hypothetical protein
MRDKIVISDNRGIVNLRSTLVNVTQSIENIEQAAPDDRDALKQLVAELFAEIENLPDAAAKDGANLAGKTEMLVADIEAGNDKDTLDGMLGIVGKIGSKFLEVAPKIPQTIDAIAKIIERL